MQLRWLLRANWMLIIGVLAAITVIVAAMWGPAWRRLGDAKEPISAAQDIVSIAAILIGGAWAMQRFGLSREWAWNLQVTAKPTILPYNDCSLLVVDVYLKNIGRILFRPKRKGVILKVYQVAQDLQAGQSALDNRTRIIKPTNLIEDYGYYYIEPGCEYHEVASFVVPKGVLLAVVVTAYGVGATVDDVAIIQS